MLTSGAASISTALLGITGSISVKSSSITSEEASNVRLLPSKNPVTVNVKGSSFSSPGCSKYMQMKRSATTSFVMSPMTLSPLE